MCKVIQNGTTHYPGLRKLIVLSILFIIFFDAFFSFLLGPLFREATLTVFLLIASVYVFVIPKDYISRRNFLPFLVTCSAMFAFLISIPVWKSWHNAYSYLGIPVAFLVYHTDFAYTKKKIYQLLILAFILACYEFLSQRYLFVNTIIKNGEIITYDLKTAGGANAVLRVKAYFYGCLSLGLFALGVAFLYSKRIWILLLCLLTALMAGTRSALLCMLPMILLQDSSKKRISTYLVIGLTMMGVSLFVMQYSPSSWDRIIGVFELTDGHSNRFLMWKTGWQQFLSESGIHMLLCNNGAYFLNYNNNPESGWICLLTDNGIVGFLIYFLPIAYLGFRFFMQRQLYLLFVLGLFTGINFGVTFHLSGTGNLVYWLCVFNFHECALLHGKMLFPDSTEREKHENPPSLQILLPDRRRN